MSSTSSRPRRGAAADKSYNEKANGDDIDIESSDEKDEEVSVPPENVDDDDDLMDTDSEEEPRKERNISRRASSRSTRFKNSMAEPTAASLESITRIPKSPTKSPARRHVQRRSSLAHEKKKDDEDFSDDEKDDEIEEEDSDEEEGDEEPLKIRKVIASRTETKKTWLEIGKSMNTSEIEHGSRWFQKPKKDENLDGFEERFLVLWSDLSFLHVSWENHQDLVDQADGKAYLATFFRKSHNGYLYSTDERCDGDYFDPAYCQVERILEVQGEEDDKDVMVLDKSSPDFDSGTGRQFLVKWGHLNYSEATYEFERDLVLNEIEYLSDVEAFTKRSLKPTKKDRRAYLKQGEDEYKHMYGFFGDKSKLSESNREKKVDEYKTVLQENTYKNGGQLRDYQAEGVAWMISNFVNQRSCALCDEMGLGKTLQTAATVDVLSTKLNRGGPTLIVAPLSTLPHWYREFCSWTDLNAIVYHGTADDRRLIRQHEFVYECDRPKHAMGFNAHYLKCCAKRKTKAESPWMVDVVITTPETMVLDDAIELAAVQWEVLVVDEAQKLKNYKSKLAATLRDDRFSFRHKMLLTGTPIQNDMQEFWTLLNFMDPDSFGDLDEFLERYGRESMQSKERLDELHEEIRPYILRRMKEDVEKSVPPKEETLIEVELTVAQKTYYRALYEKNVKYLHKNKKALDGPSLNNLAMQLRKCCNHLFLLNGVEEDFREKENTLSEGDLLVKGSGKLVLLDKLLPRLKSEGHRILIFSQFKIMLDVLEDYLQAREFKFERIDGSITGLKRQQAIDRFQGRKETKDPPFVMMLSTRAGGVGINLTAADTCIIFDSDWNPQNDLQAQARCHRIGQTKAVKIYRLLTRKTYEMQMFHMSSLKMGLDQAVLTGFEGTRSGESTLSKAEVEKLLRHGAYSIFNEDQAGEGEAASNEFVQQDIDSILQRHSRTVVHDNTGSNSSVAGGTFSKASFKARSPDGKDKNQGEDVDIEDPDFWKKMIGEGGTDDDEKAVSGKRQRKQANYSEKAHKKELEALLDSNDSADDADDSSAYSDAAENEEERGRWGGRLPTNWNKDDAERVLKALCSYGYCHDDWPGFVGRLGLSKQYPTGEVKRLCWSMFLYALVDNADDEVESIMRREAKASEKSKDEQYSSGMGVLAETGMSVEHAKELRKSTLRKLLELHSDWLRILFHDAETFAKTNEARAPDDKKAEDEAKSKQPHEENVFFSSVWPSLASRGWTQQSSEASRSSKPTFLHNGKRFKSFVTVLESSQQLHPELENVLASTLELFKKQEGISSSVSPDVQENDVTFNINVATNETLIEFAANYAPYQLVRNRTEQYRMRFPKKMLSAAKYVHCASALVKKAVKCAGEKENVLEKLATSLDLGTKLALPKGTWSSSHDAVLVLAIAKHGWIEQDASARSIAEDASLKWGPPFDSMENSVELSKRASREDTLAVATRVVEFLNGHSGTGKMLGELKWFNLSHLVQAYDLVHPTESSVWCINESKLLSGTVNEPIDLPPKRELIRRAKLLLSGKKMADPKTMYATLDQDNRAMIFLREILRSVLKEPSGSHFSRILCQYALCEAKCGLDSAEKSGCEAEIRRMTDILSQIETVSHCLSGPVVQYKNLIRATLSEDIQRPRKEGEHLFPKVLLSRKDPPKKAEAKGEKPTGEEAIEQAQKRMIEQFNDKLQPTASSSLQLTEIETLILSSAISYGIPVWTPHWRESLEPNVGTPPKDKLFLNWFQFGRIVVEEGERSFRASRDKLVRVQQELGVLVRGPQDANSAQARGACHASYECAQQKYVSKENVLMQAKDYSKEPETLAKKTTMLLAKINQVVSPVQESSKCDNGLGSEVIGWMGTEVARWAGSLDLLDGANQPLAFTAVEFLDELPEDERTSIEIASVFDKKGCRFVLSQISLLTRLRSITAKYGPSVLVGVLQSSLEMIKPAERFNGMPEDWEASADVILLYRLLQFGLSNDLLSAITSYRPLQRTLPAFNSQSIRLSKGDVQLRANQLARELHRYQTIAETTGKEHANQNGQQEENVDSQDNEVIVIDPPVNEKRKSVGTSSSQDKKQRMR